MKRQCIDNLLVRLKNGDLTALSDLKRINTAELDDGQFKALLAYCEFNEQDVQKIIAEIEYEFSAKKISNMLN